MGRPPKPKSPEFTVSLENYTEIIDNLKTRIERKDKFHFDLNNILATSKIMDDYLRDEKYASLKQSEKHLVANSIYLYLRKEYFKKQPTSN